MLAPAVAAVLVTGTPVLAVVVDSNPHGDRSRAGLAAHPCLQKQGQQGQRLRVDLLQPEPATAATADRLFMKIQFLGFTVSQLSAVQQNPFVQNTLLAL